MTSELQARAEEEAEQLRADEAQKDEEQLEEATQNPQEGASKEEAAPAPPPASADAEADEHAKQVCVCVFESFCQ